MTGGTTFGATRTRSSATLLKTAGTWPLGAIERMLAQEGGNQLRAADPPAHRKEL